LIYKVSGLGNMSKKFSKMTEKFTKKDEEWKLEIKYP
jgi:hypothetical protein